MKIHTIEEGECLLSVSYENGHYWERVWNDPENAELKKKRAHANILLPGDQVFIPDIKAREVSKPTGAMHRFRLRSMPAEIKLRFLDSAGEPRAGVPYTLTVEGKVFHGKTDGQGVVVCPLPPNAVEGKIVLQAKNGAEEYPLMFRYLDPLETISGVQGRLRNLGFYDGEIDSQNGESTQAAVITFQTRHGIKATGIMDEATRQALVKAHGS